MPRTFGEPSQTKIEPFRCRGATCVLYLQFYPLLPLSGSEALSTVVIGDGILKPLLRTQGSLRRFTLTAKN